MKNIGNTCCQHMTAIRQHHVSNHGSQHPRLMTGLRDVGVSLNMGTGPNSVPCFSFPVCYIRECHGVQAVLDRKL